ncbi:TFIIH basal transcription factor complex helicase XPB subunit [Fasciola gigantica]|uniref:TFIIH basal transcription factor complex helicase XPB subunit n=1 Tax=Fasciola gigantica TaxID=46835 RepID=A0A504YHE7_FASGI|nr:TFIIH basal transcription factor complex helicase XPB subunit [Fasciola gigantica]
MGRSEKHKNKRHGKPVKESSSKRARVHNPLKPEDEDSCMSGSVGPDDPYEEAEYENDQDDAKNYDGDADDDDEEEDEYESGVVDADEARVLSRARRSKSSVLKSTAVGQDQTQSSKTVPAGSSGDGAVACTPRDEFGAKDMRHLLHLRPDHPCRPLWIGPDGHIFLEAFSPLARQAQDFLVAIAEPVCRPTHIHEYKLTSYSLYAAVSVGLRTGEIIGCLRRLCKTDLPPGIVAYIRSCTLSYGKAKLVLKGGRFFVESPHRRFLQQLASDPTVRQCLIRTRSAEDKDDEAPDTVLLYDAAELAQTDPVSFAPEQATQNSGLGFAAIEVLHMYAQLDAEEEAKSEQTGKNGNDGKSTKNTFLDPTGTNLDLDAIGIESEAADREGELDDEDTDNENGNFGLDPKHALAAPERATLLAIEVIQDQIELLQRRCIELEVPLLAEYDFRQDKRNRDIAIDLKASTTLRPYQEKSLRKMFGNGRARSGVIVLPCGAGKTLVGVTAACTVRKPTFVLCTSGVAVEQWRSQFKLWSNRRRMHKFRVLLVMLRIGRRPVHAYVSARTR